MRDIDRQRLQAARGDAVMAAMRDAKAQPWPQRYWLHLAGGAITLIDSDKTTNRADLTRVALALMVLCGCERPTFRWSSQKLKLVNGAHLRPASADEVLACLEAMRPPVLTEVK